MKASEHQVKPETDIRSRRDKSPSREPPHPPSELLTSIRTGIGNDLHRLIPGRKLILGGVRIPFAKGPAGHSDGDALAHAICDALLGAAARQEGAAILGIPSVDTVKQVQRNMILGSIPRERIVLAQTPQAFRYEIIREAYGRAIADGFYGTDDSSLPNGLATASP